MATLADELAADLDFSDDDQQQGSDIDEEQEALNQKTEQIIEDEDMDQAGDTKSEKTSNSVRKIARLLDSKQTQDVLEVSPGTFPFFFYSV